MYLYETHLHTYPVSRCAHETADVEDCLRFYKQLGYDGVFVTNHFLDGNINIDKNASYEEKINFYFSDYEKALLIADSIGIKVFCAVETSYGGTDFLIYKLDKQWFLQHPEWRELKKSDQLKLFAEHGAFIIQAHPYREAFYIDHIRLFPRLIHGVEVINASCNELVNRMAGPYAEAYELAVSAGSDNHAGSKQKKLAGIATEQPLNSVDDFVNAVKERKVQIFSKNLT